MKAQITFVDNNGDKHTWLFKSWYDMCDKFVPGDKIKILFNDVKIYDGIFELVDRGTLFVSKDVGGDLYPFPLSSVIGVNKPKD